METKEYLNGGHFGIRCMVPSTDAEVTALFHGYIIMALAGKQLD